MTDLTNLRRLTTPGMARVPREGIATPVGSRTPCCKIVHFMAAIESGWPPAFICIITSGTYSTFRGALVRPYVGILFLPSTELTDDEKSEINEWSCHWEWSITEWTMAAERSSYQYYGPATVYSRNCRSGYQTVWFYGHTSCG